MTTPDTPRDSTGTTIGGGNGPTLGQILGVVVVLANFGLMFVDAIVLHEKIGTSDVLLHGTGFALAGFLLYPNKFLALVGLVKDKFPSFGGSS